MFSIRDTHPQEKRNGPGSYKMDARFTSASHSAFDHSPAAFHLFSGSFADTFSCNHDFLAPSSLPSSYALHTTCDLARNLCRHRPGQSYRLTA